MVMGTYNPSTSGLDIVEAELALVLYPAIGTLLIAAPAAIAIGFGKRSEAVLAGMRTWLDAHGHAVVLGTLLVLGAWLVGTGLSGFRR
jgi:Sap, sulfolipid-1-addressing protein